WEAKALTDKMAPAKNAAAAGYLIGFSCYARRGLVLLQMLTKEPHHLHGRQYTVRYFAPAVTLVRKEDVLHRHSAVFQCLHNLFRFNHGHVGVIRTVLHHGRGFDAVELIDG